MPILPDTKFYAWHFMPYTALPASVGEQGSLWVDFPNSHFDPVVGHGLYQRYMSELVLADRLGFDGVCVNEHHNTPLQPDAQSLGYGGGAHSAGQRQHLRDGNAAGARPTAPTRRSLRHARRHVGRTP